MYKLTPVILNCMDEYWLPYALESLAGWFDRYVIYDVGSKDASLDIIEWFYEKEKHRAEFFIRKLPMCDPIIQGAFRNSMAHEAISEWTFMVDADEIYTQEALKALSEGMYDLSKVIDPMILYGVFRRKEVCFNLKEYYSRLRSHHRLYNRRAIFKGPHPGEEVIFPQNKESEFWFENLITYHFHGTERSRFDNEVPKRLERRTKQTYTPGEPLPFSLLDEVPILRKPIEDFPVNPQLKLLQNGSNPL